MRISGFQEVVCAGKDSRIIPEFREKENITGDESASTGESDMETRWKRARSDRP
jgi:hypothetical protein